MTSQRFHSSLAVSAGGFFAFAILISGLWHPKMPLGGRTQVGREESVTFEDGSVMSLSESATDSDILKKRRMRGWGGHEFRQTYVLSDGREIEVTGNRPGGSEDGEDLDSGDRLILASNNPSETSENSALDEARNRAGKLQIDGTYRVASPGSDKGGWIYVNVINTADAKDQVFFDAKDPLDAPAKDSTAENSFAEQSLYWFMRGGPNELGIGSLLSNGLMGSGMGGSSSGNGNGGTVSAPPIGIVTAVPEPSTLALAGVAGALGLACLFRQRRCS